MKLPPLVLVGLALVALVVWWQGNTDGDSPISTSTPQAEETSLGLDQLARQEFIGTDFVVGPVLAKNESYTRHFITYKSNGLTISGIMNVPVGAGPFPVLILNHGHIETSVYTNGRGLRREQDYFARHGYIVVHPDYRNHAQSDKTDTPDGGDFRFGYTADAINAVYALRSSNLSYVDSKRIGMMGHSMGGGITMNVLVVKPDLVNAAILYAPVSADVRDNFEKWTRKRTDAAQIVLDAYGEPADNPEVWDALSPINYLSRIKAPILIQHGTADTDTPIQWSEKLVAASQNTDINLSLNTYPGQPHEFTTQWGAMMASSLEFFNTYLKPS